MTAKLDGFHEISGHQNVNSAVGKLNLHWHWIMPSLSSKQKTPTAAVPPSICIGTLCIATRFALIRSQGTLRCQDSFPNKAPVSRLTDITATNHVGNVHENWLFFCENILCAQKAIFLFQRGSPTWQPHWMVSTKFLASKMPTPQLENEICPDTESYRHCFQNQKPQQQLFQPPSSSALYVFEYVLRWLGSKDP